jgi:tetratricopeptide (TPR) repeat protein
VDLEEYHEAETWLNKALGLYPKNPRLLSLKALVDSFGGRPADALMASDDALAAKGEDFPELWIDRGAALLLKGSFDTAKMNFAKVLESQPEEWFWLLRVGILYLKAGKTALAVDCLLKAAERGPGIPYVWYRLGQSYQALGNQPRARSAYEKALEIDPHCHVAQEKLNSLRRSLCFIATCLGLDDDRLAFLRERRDCLRRSSHGEYAWKFYSFISPPLVDILTKAPVLKAPLRRILMLATDYLRKSRK